MTKLLRTIPAAFALVFAIVGVSTASAQAEPATISASDAQAFMGAWAVEIDAQGQLFVMNLDVKTEDGNVAAELTNEMMPGVTKAEKVARSGDDLVLSFTIDAQGQIVPMVMTLTPAGEELDAEVDFAGGMFFANGKGKKR